MKVFAITLFFATVVSYASDYIPLIQYDYLSLDSQAIRSPSLGFGIKGKDSLFFGTYSKHSLKNSPSYNYPREYHGVELFYERTKNKGQILAVLKSESDKPVFGGFNTIQAALVYGVKLGQSKKCNIIFGGGLGVSDFGIELENGEPWPLLPVSFFRLKYSARWVNLNFDFITNPSLNLVLAPESQLRVIGDFRTDQFRDIRDLIFTLAFAYRFFDKGHAMGDFAGFSVGIKNDNYGAFELSRNSKESLEIHYYSLFAELDLSLLKIAGGYAFKGRELYGEDVKKDLGHGYFVSVQGMFQF